MSCCNSCETKGGDCADKVSAVPAGVIVPREPDFKEVIEVPPTLEGSEEVAGPFARLRSGKCVPVNNRLKLGEGETTASEPLTVGECTRGSVDVVLFVLNSLTSVEAILEGGVDGDNWVRISSTVFTTAGFARFRFERVAFRLLRLYYTTTGSPGGVGVVATTVNGSRS